MGRDIFERYMKLQRELQRRSNWFVDGKEELAECTEHIARLVYDSVVLFEAGSYPSSAFLALTALEEIGKVMHGVFRKVSSETVQRSKDPMYRHADKHALAVGPTLPIGTRLRDAIGSARVDELVELAQTGQLAPLRASCLYAERQEGRLVVPSSKVNQKLARELLLLAMEAFDDANIDATSHGAAIEHWMSEMFTYIASSMALK